MLTKNFKIDNDQKNNYLILAKYLSIYASQISKNKLSVESNKLLEDIIVAKANQLDKKFGELVEGIFTSNLKNLLQDECFADVEKDLINIWDKATQVIKVLFKNIHDNYFINDNISSLIEDIIKYYFIKNEMMVFLKQKKKHLGFVNDENYEYFSSQQMILLDRIRQMTVRIDVDLSEHIISEITELDIKVNLSDLPPMTYNDWFALLIKYAILIFWAIVILYPIFILLKQSFNDRNSKVIIDIQNFIFTTNTYKGLFAETLFLRWLLNSTMIALANMFFTIFIVSLTAYSFSRFKYKGKSAFLIALLVTQMIPSFTSIIVYYIMTELLKASFSIPPVFTLIFIYTGGGVASNTVILKGYMDSISQDIDDAARIDGCSHFWIYSRIIMPLCKPMIVLIALMSFIGPFGDVILPQLILKNQEDYTVAVGLNMFINSERLKTMVDILLELHWYQYQLLYYLLVYKNM
ncbi:Maltose ABC transporter permease protein [Spiroplasma clarkii]|uniref:sugar ABC transporter permease n=1 Tax=Spiroplasma clarkii TaxID=2139 RepID=UPI000B57BA3C|nr:ABC transporter permease subunit [Spiroplasma clarkii]ARU91014.1 Maltose ABC transporter permease protein [Spiroplasma clarkii]